MTRSTKASKARSLTAGTTPLEEVQEIIVLPDFDAKAAKKQQDPEIVEIPQDIIKQAHLLVSKIASMYNDNPFHNFEHASHVAMVSTADSHKMSLYLPVVSLMLYLYSDTPSSLPVRY